MRGIRKIAAVLMLAVLVCLGTQTAFAENGGVILSDRQASASMSMLDIVAVFLKTGVLLSDRDGVLLSDRDGVLLSDTK
jgi:hypothetical protein